MKGTRAPMNIMHNHEFEELPPSNPRSRSFPMVHEYTNNDFGIEKNSLSLEHKMSCLRYKTQRIQEKL